MERSNISGMTVDEYREWMKRDMNDLYLVNNAESVDEIVQNMKNKTLMVSSINENEYRDIKKTVNA